MNIRKAKPGSRRNARKEDLAAQTALSSGNTVVVPCPAIAISCRGSSTIWVRDQSRSRSYWFRGSSAGNSFGLNYWRYFTFPV